MAELPFDERVANELLRYARLVVARGYIHNSLGNIAVRVPPARDCLHEARRGVARGDDHR